MKIFKRNTDKNYKKYYSQNGEDVVLLNFVKNFPKEELLYLDIGANHPIIINNTYLLYEQGFKGVSIEPNKALCVLHKKVRPNDIILNFGIGDDGSREFFQLNNHTLSTFSKEEAQAYIAMNRGYKIEDSYLVNLISVSKMLKDHFKTSPKIISLDVEGLEMEILLSFDFDKYRPVYFVIETYSWAKDRIENDIIDFMNKKGFNPILTMGANTIFKDSKHL